MLIPPNASAPDGKDLDVIAMKISEANQLDNSAPLPSWLKPDDEDEEGGVYDDPYLSFEDAYLYDHELKYKNKEVPLLNIEDDDDFRNCRSVLT